MEPTRPLSKGFNDDRATTIITEGTKLTGKINSSGGVFLDGELNGSLTSNNYVVIGEKGFFTGDIEANSVIISGNFTGQIKTKVLKITSSATVNIDNLIYRTIHIEENKRILIKNINKI